MNVRTIRRLVSVGLVALLVITFIFTIESFFTARNVQLLLKDSAYVGLMALGISFVIIGGGIDLSGGGIVCLTGIIVARFSFLSPAIPGIVVLLAGVIVGVALGAVNSFFINKLHLTEFVATLASGFVYFGLALILAFRDRGRITSMGLAHPGFSGFGKTFGGVYIITIFWIIAVVIAQFVLRKTKFGLHTYAMGSNSKASQMSGVTNEAIKSAGFLIAGACYGLAAALVVAFQNATAVSLGTSMEFQGIAACVVGGLVLGGGKGDAVGSLIGALFMTLLLNGLFKLGLETAWQYMVQGLVIVFAIMFDVQFNRIYQKRILSTSGKSKGSGLSG